MSSGTNRCGEALGGDEEGDAVGTELVEEGREEVHCLEGPDMCRRGEVCVGEGGDDEEDEVESEADLHHVFAAVELVVDEEC